MKNIEYFDPSPYLTTPDKLKEDVDLHNVAFVDLGEELNPETLYSLAERLGPVMDDKQHEKKHIVELLFDLNPLIFLGVHQVGK